MALKIHYFTEGKQKVPWGKQVGVSTSGLSF